MTHVQFQAWLAWLTMRNQMMNGTYKQKPVEGPPGVKPLTKEDIARIHREVQLYHLRGGSDKVVKLGK